MLGKVSAIEVSAIEMSAIEVSAIERFKYKSLTIAGDDWYLEKVSAIERCPL